MTNAPAPTPQALMQESRPEKSQKVEHINTKNSSQPKTLYITEEAQSEPPTPAPSVIKEESKKPTPQTPKPDTNAADDQAFYSCSTARDYDNYLRNYPNGKHRAEASQELSALVKQSAHNNDYSVEDIPPRETAAGSLPLNRQGAGVVETNTSVNVRFDGGGAGRFSSPPPVRSHGGNNYRGGGGGGHRSGGYSGGGSRGGGFGGGSRSGGGSSHRHSR